MGLLDFLRKKRERTELEIFQASFEKAFAPLKLPFLKKAQLLVSLYEAFKDGRADNGASVAAQITGETKRDLKPLLDRTWRLAHSQLQWQRIIESADTFPFLMFDVTDKTRARPQCVEMDGRARRVDDPFWKTNYPPCERPDCLCRVIQMGQRQIDRQGVTIIPSDTP